MRRGAVKAVALLVPLLLGAAALRLWGAPLGGSFQRMLARRAYSVREEPPFRVLARTDGPHEEALASLRGWMRALSQQHAALGLRAEGPILIRLFDSEEDAAAFGSFPAAPACPGGSAAWSVGPGEISLVCSLPRRWTTRDERALFHALTHVQQAGRAPRNAWLEEGLASWLEELRPGGPLPRAGGLAPDVVRAARERSVAGGFVGLPELLAAAPADFAGRRGAAFHRSAQLFTAYLLDARTDLFRSAWEGNPRLDGLQEAEPGWIDWMDSLR